MNLITALKNIGFTQQEALIYITLSQNGESSGYEVAKLTSISRSNAYAALSSLTEKGGASIIDSSTIKYIATTKDELLVNTKRKFDENMEFLKENLPSSKISKDPYITISKYENIINKVKNMINFSKSRIYICANGDDITLFEDELFNATKRGLKVVIISPKEVDFDCIYYPSNAKHSIKLIVDTEEVISGQLEPISESQCLYSKNQTLVNLIKESFTNEIQLIEIKEKK